MSKVSKSDQQKTIYRPAQEKLLSVDSALGGTRTNVAYVRSKKSSPPPISTLKTKKVIAFGWYGGKFSHLDWLLPLLPSCHHYCEPFGGSGAVLLNRPPSPVETYNDLDGEVVNFFRVLRDEKEKLIEAIGLTPFSREEFNIACIIDPDVSPLERARRFFVRARQVRTGLAQVASLGRWANCKNTSRAGMSGVISRWLGSIEDLPEIAERLLRVQKASEWKHYGQTRIQLRRAKGCADSLRGDDGKESI